MYLGFVIGFVGGLLLRGWFPPWKQGMDRLNIARLEELCGQNGMEGKRDTLSVPGPS